MQASPPWLGMPTPKLDWVPGTNVGGGGGRSGNRMPILCSRVGVRAGGLLIIARMLLMMLLMPEEQKGRRSSRSL